MKLKINKNLVWNICKYSLIIVFGIACVVAAILIDTKFRTEVYSFIAKYFTNVDFGNIICATQIGISAFTITLVSFTSTHNNQSYFGMDAKDILKLKQGFKLNLLRLTLIELVLSIASVLVFYLKWYCLLTVTLLFTIVTCFYYCIVNVPLIIKSDKALIKLLKQNYQKMESLADPMFNKLFNNFIEEHGFEYTYNKLKTNRNEKLLFEAMLRSSIDYLNNMSTYSDIPSIKQKVNTSINCFIENIKFITNNKSQILIDKTNYDKISVFIAQFFEFAHQREKQLDNNTLKRISNCIDSLYWTLVQDRENKTAEFVFKSFELLFKYSIEYEDLWFVNELKCEFSKIYYTFAEKNNYWAKKLFAEISLILFYYYQYEDLVSKEFKDNIKSFIDNQKIISPKESTYSWRTLFTEFINNFSLELKDFCNNFNATHWEFIKYNTCKSCVINESFQYEWWLKCLFSSELMYNYDISNLNNLTDKEKQNFANTLDRLFDENGAFKINNSFNDFEKFYGLQENFTSIDSDIELVQNLYTFKNEHKKQKEFEYVNKNNCDEVNLSNLKQYLFEQLEKKLTGSITYDKSLEIPKNKKARGIYVLQEMFNLETAKSLFLEMLLKTFSKEFKDIVTTNLENHAIEFTKENLINNIQKLKRKNPSHASSKVLYSLNRFENYYKNKLQEYKLIDKNIEEVKDDCVLPNNLYLNKKGVRFNYNFEVFELNKLDESQLQNELDRYKKEDGTYFYKGIRFEYQELKQLLLNKLFTIKCYIIYDIKIDKRNVALLDPWGYYRRMKERKAKKKTD